MPNIAKYGCCGNQLTKSRFIAVCCSHSNKLSEKVLEGFPSGLIFCHHGQQMPEIAYEGNISQGAAEGGNTIDR